MASRNSTQLLSETKSRTCTSNPDRQGNSAVNPGRKHILVVEDEEAIRTGLLDVFVFHGYEVQGADNGSDGLRAAMVYHLAEHGTRDVGKRPTPVNDWMRLPDG